MPSGFLRTASAVRGGVMTIDRMAVKRLASLAAPFSKAALQPAHLERCVGRAHDAGDLDGDRDAADAGEGIVLARVFVQGQRGAVGGIVVGAQPVLAHDHRIDRQRAHVLDEARQVEGDLRIARPVVLGRGRDRAHRPVAIDLHHERHGGAAAAEPDQADRQQQRHDETAEREQPPVVRLGARRADALVPYLRRLLVGRDRLGAFAVAQRRALEPHGALSFAAVVFEVGRCRRHGTVALAHRLAGDEGGIAQALTARQALRPRRGIGWSWTSRPSAALTRASAPLRDSRRRHPGRRRHARAPLPRWPSPRPAWTIVAWATPRIAALLVRGGNGPAQAMRRRARRHRGCDRRVAGRPQRPHRLQRRHRLPRQWSPPRHRRRAAARP